MTPTDEPERTPYQEMMWRALIKKTIKNFSPRRRSKRDDIRDYNKTHKVQLSLRPHLKRDNT